MNKQNQLLADYVFLAEASYTNFSKSKDHLKNLEDTQPKSFAKLVTDSYTVVAHYKDRAWIGLNDESSFSGTLFKGKAGTANAGKYVLAMRGTQQLGSDLLSADAGDIVYDGLAHHQIVDMYNFGQQIKAEKGERYKVARIIDVSEVIARELLEIFQNNPNDDEWIGKGYFVDSGSIKKIVFEDSDKVYNDERAWGLGINPDKVVVTGHSLGGHLSAAFARLFPDMVEHAYMVNGAGFGSSLNPIGYVGSSIPVNIFQVFSALGGSIGFDAEKITNIIGDKAPDVVANDWTVGLKQPGQKVDLFIETKGLASTFGHGSDQMSDSMAVASLFFAMDSSLNTQDIKTALNLLNPIFQAAHSDDEKTLETIVHSLGKLFFGENAPNQANANDRNELYQQIMNLRAVMVNGEDSGKDGYENGGKYRILSLVENQAWQAVAHQESGADAVAIRYALKNLNPFAIVGADYQSLGHNSNGELDLYSADKPNGMTETYIRQRIAMLQDMAAKYTGLFYPDYHGKYYEDKDSGVKIGNETFEVSDLNVIDAARTLFGTGQTDALTGGQNDDFLFGGEGDDTLEGNSGKNYLEGGKGNDTYIIDSSGNILFDADMKGKIIFKGGVFSADIQAARFERDESDKNLDVWYSVDKTGKADKKFTAVKRDNDLHIIRNNANDSVLIKDFFILSQFENNAFRGLGLILGDRDEKQDEEGYKLYLGDQHAPVSGTNKLYDWSKTSWNNKTGVLNGAIKKADFDDVINGSATNDKIYGLGGNDALAGLDGDDWLDGGAGDDLIVGGAGRDKLFGGSGNDIIASDGKLHINNRVSENDQWTLPSRYHSYFSKGPQWGAPQHHSPIRNEHGEVVNYATIVSQPAEITMFTTLETLYISNSSQIGDEIDGGEGHDLLYGSNADDIIYGGSGSDFLSGWGGNDTLIGGEGNDNIFGDGEENEEDFNKILNGIDIISGGNGNDTIFAGSGNDIVYGDGGNDQIYGDYYTDSDLEIFGDDYLNGGDGDDLIWGGKGNDIIYGGKDSDALHGNEGNDELYGQEGGDKLWGLDGNDILYGGDGDDFISGDDGRLTDQGKLTGNDYLYGGNGSDSMYGGKGNDYLYGDDGRDYLYGGEGDDYLYGGDGTDYLEGNKGINYLTGGAGNDFFRTSKAQAGINIITDFQDGDAIVSHDERKGIMFFIRMGNDLILLPEYAFSGELNVNNKVDVVNNSNIKTIVKDFFKLPKNTQSSIYNYTVEQVMEFLRNHDPVISTQIPVVSAVEGTQFIYILPENLFSDPDNDPLNINLTMADGSALPSWLNYHNDTRTLSGTPGFEDAGSLNLKITATDWEGLSASQDWRIDITDTNRPPQAQGTLADQILQAGQKWSYTIPVDQHFSDPDNETLHYNIVQADGSPLPAWMVYDAATHTLSGQAPQAGSLQLNISTTDGAGAGVSLPLNLTVKPTEKPVIPPSSKPQPPKTMTGSLGHDSLAGGTGNDILRGLAGNDILTGGKGNDRLEGGLGNDTYIFNKGDGRDRIFDQAGKDTLRLQGIDADQLWFRRDGNKLKIQIIGTQDEISVDNHYAFGTPPVRVGHRLPVGVYDRFGVSMPLAKGAGQIETFRLDDGRSLTAAQADKLIQAMAAFRPQQGGNLSVPEQMQQYLQQINVSSLWK